MISTLLNVLRLVLWRNSWSTLDNVPNALENTYCVVTEERALEMQVRDSLFSVRKVFPCLSYTQVFQFLYKIEH